jgi:two-component system NtrC family sensor kinase
MEGLQPPARLERAMIRSRKKGLKANLIVKFIAIIALTTLISCVMGTLLINKWTMGQAESRAKNSLNTGREVLNNRLENIRNTVRFTAAKKRLLAALRNNNRADLQQYLEDVRNESGLDILNVADSQGRVVAMANNPACVADRIGRETMIGGALASGETISSVEILPYEALRKEGDELAARCVSDARSVPLTAAMVLMSASPVFQDGKVAGVVWGGEVLNRDDGLVDKIRDILYQNERYRGRDIGVATLFMRNVRISTNFRNPDGSRAIGSVVAEDVAQKVLGEGKQWVGTASVVHKGYVAGYEPIRNYRNEIVGMLAVGMLEQKFSDMRAETLAIFLGISLLGVIMSILAANFFSNSIVKPVNNLVAVSQAISRGDFSVRVETKSAAEIGELETTFNLMASALKARDEEIGRLNRQHIMRSEKLASIGRLAAGIAHEINNPLTSVLTFSSLLLKNAEDGQKERLDIIVKETTRCREIVRRLLNFSRQTEPRKEKCNVNLVVENALSLTKNQLQAGTNAIAVKKDLAELPPLQLDRNQMLEVLINMIINAADAMAKGGGELGIKTCLTEDGKAVEIRISDTGCGISKENLEKVFDPFFTTKAVGKGTGLGLAVTYGIIDGHNGSIDVESEVGKGTMFVIRMPLG